MAIRINEYIDNHLRDAILSSLRQGGGHVDNIVDENVSSGGELPIPDLGGWAPPQTGRQMFGVSGNDWMGYAAVPAKAYMWDNAVNSAGVMTPYSYRGGGGGGGDSYSVGRTMDRQTLTNELSRGTASAIRSLVKGAGNA